MILRSQLTISSKKQLKQLKSKKPLYILRFRKRVSDFEKDALLRFNGKRIGTADIKFVGYVRSIEELKEYCKFSGFKNVIEWSLEENVFEKSFLHVVFIYSVIMSFKVKKKRRKREQRFEYKVQKKLEAKDYLVINIPMPKYGGHKFDLMAAKDQISFPIEIKPLKGVYSQEQKEKQMALCDSSNNAYFLVVEKENGIDVSCQNFKFTRDEGRRKQLESDLNE